MKNIKSKIVLLNNKTRKGQYVYIKEPKKPARYYKYIPSISINEYKEYYMAKKDKTKIAINPKRKKHKKIQQKTYNLNKSIGSGINKVYIKNIKEQNNYKIKKAYKDLLNPLVADKEILQIITQDTNINKIKHRFEYKVWYINDKGDKIGIANKIGTTIKEIQKDHKKIIKGESITDGSLGKIRELMKKKGYKYQHYLNSKLDRIDLEIIFRKK